MADFTNTGPSSIVSSIGQKLAPPIAKRDINAGLSEYGLKPTSLKGKSDSDLYKMAQDTVINWYKSKKAKVAPVAKAAPAPKAAVTKPKSTATPKPKATATPKPKATTTPKPKTTVTKPKATTPAVKPKPTAATPNYTGKMGLL